jgi:hypothetical protein
MTSQQFDCVNSSSGGGDGGDAAPIFPEMTSCCPVSHVAPPATPPWHDSERNITSSAPDGNGNHQSRHHSSLKWRRRRRQNYLGSSTIMNLGSLILASIVMVWHHRNLLPTSTFFTAAAAAATPVDHNTLEDKIGVKAFLHAEAVQHRYAVDPNKAYERRSPPTSPPTELHEDDDKSLPRKPLTNPSVIEEELEETKSAVTTKEEASAHINHNNGAGSLRNGGAAISTTVTATTTDVKKPNSKPKPIPQLEKKHLKDEDIYIHEHDNPEREAKDTAIKKNPEGDGQARAQVADECECHSVWKEGGAKLAYLIVVHNARTADDAVPLYQALRRPNTIVLIHIDTKFSTEKFEQTSLYDEIIKRQCTCDSITQIHSIYDSQWGEWSMNDPTHWAMRQLVNERDTQFTFDDGTSWDVFLNLSGDTMPTLTQEVISDLFAKQLKGINFVTSSSCETGLVPTSVYTFPSYWHKRNHYTHHPDGNPILTHREIQPAEEEGNVTEKVQSELTIYFGSQWMALTPKFVDYVVHGLARPDSLASQFKLWLEEHGKLMADETFIPTLLMNVPQFSSTIPPLNDEDGSLETLTSSEITTTNTKLKMFSIRYERMDEHAPTAFGWHPTDQRYEVPKSSTADKPKIWGPYFLGLYDLGNIRRSGALFVRKVSRTVEPNLVNLLPVNSLEEDLPHIEWPFELLLSEKPDWEKRKTEYIQKAKRKEEEKERKRQELENTSRKHLKKNDNDISDDGDSDSGSGDGDDSTAGAAENETDEEF